MAAFAELGLCQEIIRSVEELGWILPTPVQQEAIPLVLGGGDVLVAAETGSGKTGAFALPLLQITHENLRLQMAQQLANREAQQPKQPRISHSFSKLGIFCDRDALLLVSSDGLECQCGLPNAWAGGRASIGVFDGIYFFEVEQISAGLCRVGWSTLSAKLALGTDNAGFGFGGTGKKSYSNAFDSYGEPYGLGDVIGCMIDRKRSCISFFKNGNPLGVAFEIPGSLQRQALFPAICLKGCAIRLRFGGNMIAPDGASPLASVSHEHAARNVVDSAKGAETLTPRSDGRSPTAIILEPTRELCEQVLDCIVEFSRFFSEPPLRPGLFVGGADMGAQVKLLRDGVDIAVATPGRMTDLVQSGKLNLGDVQFFVLDEADRLLDTGNLDTIMKLFIKLPKKGTSDGRLQTLLFSATLHTPEVRELAARITRHPTFVDLKGKDSVPTTVHHVYVEIDPTSNHSWTNPPSPVPTDGVHRADAVSSHSKSVESMSEGVKRLKPLVLQ